ncbi:acyl-CoA carboxylase epsilon subunit [Streptomyces stackebrandtii]|uniref:acyl-CoA carboxylase epsilon subunit n=1 Tax=Streptomyces stackebrandtii TaxID=3051177 RepID=UPI0028DBF572|nr:acyl-CoA carboxylase epsilon subunit [Streptomyces sp. DSM 40976]
MSASTPFPLPPHPADSTAAPVRPLRIISGNPTPEEVAAVTAALLATLHREPPRPQSTGADRAARWSRSHSSQAAGSWRSVPRCR